jgi:hypothetical protein
MMHHFFEGEGTAKSIAFIVCKIVRSMKSKTLKSSQPILIYSFQHEFGIKSDFKLETSASQGDKFVSEKMSDHMSHEKQMFFNSNSRYMLELDSNFREQ